MVKYAREPTNGPKSCKVRRPPAAATLFALALLAQQTAACRCLDYCYTEQAAMRYLQICRHLLF